MKTVATVFIIFSPLIILFALNYRLMFGVLIATLFFPMVVEFYASVYFAY
jgi:hypothetical protein